MMTIIQSIHIMQGNNNYRSRRNSEKALLDIPALLRNPTGSTPELGLASPSPPSVTASFLLRPAFFEAQHLKSLRLGPDRTGEARAERDRSKQRIREEGKRADIEGIEISRLRTGGGEGEVSAEVPL